MNRLNHALFFIFIVFVVSSCDLQFKDKSNSPEYANVIGKEFILAKNLYLYGITKRESASDQVDYNVIRGDYISGPEVVYREELREGVNFTVSKVYVGNIAWKKYIEYGIDLKHEKYATSKVVIRVVNDLDNTLYGLNPEWVKVIENKRGRIKGVRIKGVSTL